MKILNFRHIGMPVQDIEYSIKYYEGMGFRKFAQGGDKIGGKFIKWVKMVNDHGLAIELLDGGQYHLAFTVGDVDRDEYYFVTPSGHLVQFVLSPDGMPIELVKEPQKKGE